MTTTTFAVPCGKCGQSRVYWKHDSEPPPSLVDAAAARGVMHAYVPDESSVEWAAVKLREALDDVCASAIEFDDARMSYVVVQVDRVTLTETREALRLADEAGIR